MSSLTLVLHDDEIEPGATFTGAVRWTGDMKSFEVTLRWETSGKGDKDTMVVARTVVSVEGLPDKTSRFELTAPELPFSFSGKLISVTYFVRARDTAALHGQMEAEIVIAPGGKEVRLAGA